MKETLFKMVQCPKSKQFFLKISFFYCLLILSKLTFFQKRPVQILGTVIVVVSSVVKKDINIDGSDLEAKEHMGGSKEF